MCACPLDTAAHQALLVGAPFSSEDVFWAARAAHARFRSVQKIDEPRDDMYFPRLRVIKWHRYFNMTYIQIDNESTHILLFLRCN
jgi:hypothetical protein